MKRVAEAPFVRTLSICCNERDPEEAACANRGASEIQTKLKQYVKEHGLKKKIRVLRTSCMDLCSIGPNLCIQPDNIWLSNVTQEDLQRIIADWITPIEENAS